MLANLRSKNTLLWALSILVSLQFGLLAALWHHQQHDNSQFASEINSLQQSVISAGNGLSYQQVTVAPSEKRIYLPQLGIYIPLTSLGTSLVYSPDRAYVAGSYTIPSGPPDEASISTFTTASAPQSQTQFNCSSLVRIKFETQPDPYNPSEKPSGSVHLANGKTLQIYADHLSNCQKEWAMTRANADDIAALFKQAQSY